MDYFAMMQARRRHEELIEEARVEALVVAPNKPSDATVVRAMRWFKSLLTGRNEAQAQQPRHA